MTVVQSLQERGRFSHRVQTGTGTHPASYPVGSGGPFIGDKVAGA